MTPARATYYDGQTGDARQVFVDADGDYVRIEGEGLSLSYPLDALVFEPRLGGLPRRLDLPGGAACLVDAAFELPASPASFGTGLEHWIHVLERRWSVALAAGAALALVVWAAIVLVVPYAARRVAMGIGPSAEAKIAGQTLASLDRIALEPTRLPAERRARLSARFARLSELVGPPGSHTLVFRSSPSIGPNAFALPGGIVVVLDELVAVAEHDDEIAAVMAHEIGHVRERHAMRSVIQSSVTGVLVAAIIGDVLSASSLVAALPAVLLESRYSRGFEREADEYAVELMRRARIDTAHFGRILLRMDSRARKTGRYPDFLSSHPPSDRRARTASTGQAGS
jgi:Zn-dependent protease with chaperone function